jgi:hypothetical protein
MDLPSMEHDLYDTVSVELPRRTRAFPLALLGLSLVVLERVSAWNRLPHDSAAKLYFILFAAGVILINLVNCWRALARHWVRVSSNELRFERSALGVRDIRRYARSEVSSLRVDQQRIFTYRPWLAFDRNGKRKFIGEELERSRLDGLLEPIYSQFPDIAPEARTKTHTASS